MELTIPTADSHWSLRFVEVWRPFPQQVMANATYKVIRFFYPPFALEAVHVTHVVGDPQLNGLNAALFLGCPLLLVSFGYAVYKYKLKKKRVVRTSPERLNELEQRMIAKYGPEYKKGIWKRKDIPDPLLEGKKTTEPESSDKFTNVNSCDEEVKCYLDNQIDLVEQIDNTIRERSGLETQTAQ